MDLLNPAERADEPMARPVFDVVGDRIALGPLRRDLAPLYQRWRQNFSAIRALAAPPDPLAFDDDDPWSAESNASGEHVWFTVYEFATWRPIGVTALIGVDEADGSAEFFLHIGELDCQSQDYGTETSRLMLDYAFTALNLDSLFLMSYEFNLSGLRACELAGFREFGRQRRAHLMGGRFWDIVYMECLAVEFASPSSGGALILPQP